MKKGILSLVAAIMTAITLITIIPFASSDVEAATYKYVHKDAGVVFEGSYLGNPVCYDNRYRYYYPENYSGQDLDVVFMFTGRGKIKSIDDIEKADNVDTDEYLSRWVNNYGIKPFVLIVIKVYECCNDGEVGLMNEWDYYHYVMEGPFEQLIGLVKNGKFSGTGAGSGSNFYVTGYSMGASSALLAGTVLDGKYNFKGIGAFSPSAHFLSSNCTTAYYSNGWQNVPYPDLDYWYYSYGSAEDTPFEEHAKEYYQDICLTKSGVNAKLVKTDYWDPTDFNEQHNWRLFRRELFSFLYSVNHDYKLPSTQTVDSANDLNALVWNEPTGEEGYWGIVDDQGSNGGSGDGNIAEIEEAKSKAPATKYYKVDYYVDGSLVYTARIEENHPILKNPAGMPEKYKNITWYYSKDTQAKQVNYNKGITKDYSVNGTLK